MACSEVHAQTQLPRESARVELHVAGPAAFFQVYGFREPVAAGQEDREHAIEAQRGPGLDVYLAERAVELDIVESISHETVRQCLKKTS